MSDLTDAELQFLRLAMVGEIAPGAETLTIDPSLIQRLLDEVLRHRANLKALESNLEHWPATMTRGRLLCDLNAAQRGFFLLTLT